MQERSIFIRLCIAGFAIAAILLLAACSSEPEPERQAEQTVEAAPMQAPERTRSRYTTSPVMEELPSPSNSSKYRFVPNTEGQLIQDGDGLQSVLDGSSVESFKESLSWIAADTSKEQYRRLESAIRFLNLYHPRTVGNDDAMREVLNGMTGEEVIALAARINHERRTRRPEPRT